LKRLAADFPAYFPSITYLRKMASADVFITLDTAPFVAKSPMQRTLIDYHTKKQWLTIPVLHTGPLPVREIQIDNTKNWAVKHRKILHHAYHREAYYEFLSAEIKQVYSQSFKWLIDATFQSVEVLRQLFRLPANTMLPSHTTAMKSMSLSKYLVELMLHYQCDCYVTTSYEAAFLDAAVFTNHHIEIETIDSLPQQCELSALDWLFKNGPVLPKTAQI
jgi:hypothetical protein